MKKFLLTTFNFRLFGEDGGGAEGSAQTGGSQEGLDAGANAGENSGEQGKPEDPRAKYDEFMKDENNRRFLTEDTQKVINRRFRETKQLQEQLGKQNDVLARLYEKYNVTELDELGAAIDNDSELWQAKADEEGLTVDQYREFQKIKRERDINKKLAEELQNRAAAEQQYIHWAKEAAELKQVYPDFNLLEELKNKDFSGLIGQKNPQYSISMRQAYELVHPEALEKRIAGETEKRVTDSIKARGMRPGEGAATGNAGIVTKTDVTKLTKKDRAEIAKRVARGETITF